VITEDAVLAALRSVQDPDLKRDIVTLGFVKDIQIDGSKVSATIELTTPACPVKEILQQEAVDAVKSIGATEVDIEMTARVRQTNENVDLVPGVKNIVAIASGKGGVGKSTVSVNLAVALAQEGARVGLLDADVYGPSVPLMMGCEDEKPWTEQAKIIPIKKHGISMMSLGFLLEEGQAVLWRGPMVAGTVKQLLGDVAWGELDYLLVDLPPGTGDAPMSLAQLVPLTGVVIVATPQDVAANIAMKAVLLFKRLNAPIVGVIENMSVFVCPSCGESTKIFSGTEGADLAKSIGAPFLGSVPLDPAISESGDDGQPSIVAYPDRPQALRFREIAKELAREVSKHAYSEKDLVRGLETLPG
jgi:ATP-binding protein involved in chromosome partitioning